MFKFKQKGLGLMAAMAVIWVVSAVGMIGGATIIANSDSSAVVEQTNADN